MFSHMFTKRRALIGAGALGAVVAGALAFAFWTTSGSGSGTATAGTDAGVTVSGDPANGIYPGGSVAVTSTVTNSSATQSQHVQNLHVAISIDSAHATDGCSASWFTYKADSEGSGDSNPHTVTLDSDIAASGTQTVNGHVFMANTNTNQDACKGATINLAYTVDSN